MLLLRQQKNNNKHKQEPHKSYVHWKSQKTLTVDRENGELRGYYPKSGFFTIYNLIALYKATTAS